MAKAQAAKSKSPIGGFFSRFTSSKAKPAARPSSGVASTMTNLSAGGSAGKTGSMRVAKAVEEPGRWSMANFRLPILGSKPILQQMQVLGTLAGLLLAITAFLVFEDTRTRTRNATYVTIASQMQFHTQRLAKAAQQASQGNLEAFKQLRESRDEFAAQMKLLLAGGEAGGVSLPATSGDARPALGALDKYLVDWALVTRDGPLGRALGGERGWRTVYVDAKVTIYVRRPE